MLTEWKINPCNTSHQQNEEQVTNVFLIDAEKALNKIQHLFMLEILNKLEIEGNYHNIIKSHR